jgi:acetyl esterase/lipase
MKRSISSIIFDKLIAKMPMKKLLTDQQTFENALQDRLKQGEIPYQLKYKRFTVDVKEDAIAGMDYYILNPKKKKNKNKILYFHGGGYIEQPVSLHWRFLNKIARDTGTEIWVPIYPIIPYYNADYAYKSLLILYELFSASLENGNIILMGDSAGGGLVLGMAQQIRDMQLKQPADLIMISPWLDVTMSSPAIKEIEPKDVMLGSCGLGICGELWAGNKQTKDPMVSPLYGELNGLGRMTVFTGTCDILNADAHSLLKKAASQNITIDFNEKQYMGHVYPVLPIHEAKEAIRKIETICR